MEPFARPKPLVGMVHLAPLPGNPGASRPLADIVEAAVQDAGALADGGVDGVLVENFGDAPFAPRLGPEAVAALALAAEAVVRAVRVPVGVNALRNDGPAAMAIAHLAGARFVRANVWSGVAWTDNGTLEGCARETLLLKQRLGARVAVLADAHVKHAAHPGPLDQAVADNERNGCDAHVVSGPRTGAPAAPDDLTRAKGVATRPVFIGSGVTPQDLGRFRLADGFIVGTALKRDGRVDPKLVEALVRARDELPG